MGATMGKMPAVEATRQATTSRHNKKAEKADKRNGVEDAMQSNWAADNTTRWGVVHA